MPLRSQSSKASWATIALLFRCVPLASMILSSVSPNIRAEAIPPEKGAIQASGKFVSDDSDSPSVDTPEIAARESVETALRKDLKIERIDDNQLRIGLVTVDKAARTIRFQATVNMIQGQVEYAVVSETGKLHESVFATKASLRDIHLAVLLLGVKPGKVMVEKDRSLQVPSESAVRALVEWESNGPISRYPLSSMIMLTEGQPDQKTNRTLADSVWLYKGSGFDSEGFRALREGSVISLIGDDSALVNNPGSNRDRDDIYIPNTALLPKKGMPVSIIISLVPKICSLPNP